MYKRTSRICRTITHTPSKNTFSSIIRRYWFRCGYGINEIMAIAVSAISKVAVHALYSPVRRNGPCEAPISVEGKNEDQQRTITQRTLVLSQLTTLMVKIIRRDVSQGLPAGQTTRTLCTSVGQLICSKI
jgi:hypothetical protein